jgi:hypothetical protein
MVPGQYSLLFISMIEECRSFLCSKEDYTLQYVVLSNEVGLSPFLLILVPSSLTFDCSLNIKTVCIRIVKLILLMLLFYDPKCSVNTSSS